MTLSLAFLLALALTVCAAQHDPHWWDNRNTIVHLFEWKFKDIADECERFLPYKGYAGVQVSPVTEHSIWENRPWWERYHTLSYKIHTRSGTEDDFLNMTKRCNQVGIRIYVDIVINHMTGTGKQIIGTGGTVANPDEFNFPAVPYGPIDFNADCYLKPSDYKDNATAVRNCRLVGMHDLNQGTEYVRDKIVEFCNHLIDLGVAGFRVDSAKFMWPEDLKAIYNRFKTLNTNFGFAPGRRPFFVQDVIDLVGGAISRDEYTSFGTVTEFRHTAEIGRVFKGNVKLMQLQNWGPAWGFLYRLHSIIFIVNHDIQRGRLSEGPKPENVLTYKETKQYKMATAFMLAHPYGNITLIMSDFAFENPHQGPPTDQQGNILSPFINGGDTCVNGWVCEHRWRQIYNMIGFKNAVAGTGDNNWWSNGDQQIAFGRGDKGFVAFTNGGDLNQDLQTGLPAGQYCDVISGDLYQMNSCTGKVVTVGANKVARIELKASDEDGVLAIHIGAKLT